MAQTNCSSDSESLRASTARFREHNDKLSPAASPAERVRAHLRAARNDLDRCASYHSDSPALVALHSAVASMLAALEIT